jgi:type II restriction/modification system DNA methylase subunit YeeA
MKGLCYQGTIKNGAFDIDGETARKWISQPINPNGKGNAEVVKPWSNGMDITRRSSDTWVIDYGTDMSESAAALFETPFSHIEQLVKPVRAELRRKGHREIWWIHGESRPGMRKALKGLKRFIATPRVSKHRIFVWFVASTVPDSAIYAIARDDDTTFGILHSSFHELWSLRMGTSLEDRPRYTPSTTFETFPFPEGLTPNIPAADNAAKELKKRTLTNLYNARPAWLDNAHKALDEAVAESYGWGNDWRAGLLTEDEILARLFMLNQERAKAEAKAAPQVKVKGKKNGK